MKVPLLLFLGFFFLYLATLSPGVTWGDSAKDAIFSKEFILDPNAGYHSLHTVLSYPFNWIPVGDIAYRQNMASAFFGALSLVLLYGLVLFLTGSSWAALFAAWSLGVSHTFWYLSVMAETYTLYTLFLLAVLWSAVCFLKMGQRKFLYLSAFLSGLALSAHLLILFSLIPLVFFLLISPWFGRKEGYHPWASRLTGGVIALFFFLLGLSFLVGVAVVTAREKGWGGSQTLWRTLDLVHAHFLRGERGTSSQGGGGLFAWFHVLMALFVSSLQGLTLHLPTVAKDLFKRGGLLFYQFPFLGFGILLYGVYNAFKTQRKIAWLLSLVALFNIAFSLTYLVPKWPLMLVGVYAVGALFIGLGAAELQKRFSFSRGLRGVGCLLITGLAVGTYGVIPRLAFLQKRPLLLARTVPYRNNARYFLTPWKQNETSALHFARDVFQTVEPGSVLLSDFTPSIVLEYFLTVQHDPKTFIIQNVESSSFHILDYLKENAGQRSIYVVGGAPEYHWDTLQRQYILERRGPLWKVLRAREKRAP